MRILTLIQVSAAAVFPLGFFITPKSDGSIKLNIPSKFSKLDVSANRSTDVKIPVKAQASVAPPENIPLTYPERTVSSNNSASLLKDFPSIQSISQLSSLPPDRIESSWDKVVANAERQPKVAPTQSAPSQSAARKQLAVPETVNVASSTADSVQPLSIQPLSNPTTVTELPAVVGTPIAVHSATSATSAATPSGADLQMLNIAPSASLPLRPINQSTNQASDPSTGSSTVPSIEPSIDKATNRTSEPIPVAPTSSIPTPDQSIEPGSATPHTEQLDISQMLQQVEAGLNATTLTASQSHTATATLKAGDQLQISFVNLPEQSGSYQILSDGTLYLPTLGSVTISGLTPQQAEEIIVARYSGELNNGAVTIKPLKAHSVQMDEVGMVGQSSNQI
jgi:hypothetical protein